MNLALIDAYSDSAGSKWPNQQLSEKRAESVKKFSLTWVLMRNELKVEGHGESSMSQRMKPNEARS